LTLNAKVSATGVMTCDISKSHPCLHSKPRVPQDVETLIGAEMLLLLSVAQISEMDQ
jgi:hypothetical protein